MRRTYKILILIFFVILCAQSVLSIPYPSNDNIYVNDFANVLKQESKKYMLSNSKILDEKTSAQLVVVTVNSLEGKDIDEYSLDVMMDWGIGDPSKNNGALILLSTSDRKVKIKVGYGLEGAINDGKAGRILDNYGAPYFKSDDWDKGIVGCYFELLSEIYKEYGLDVPEDAYEFYGSHYGKANQKNDGYIELGSIILIVILFALATKKGGGPPFIGGFFTGLGGGIGGFGSGGFGPGPSSGVFGGGRAGGGGASRGF